MIAVKKKAPSLATRGKSTFSEGGGDKRSVFSNILKHHGIKFYIKNAAVQYLCIGFTMTAVHWPQIM
jgi:hypothetical protein